MKQEFCVGEKNRGTGISRMVFGIFLLTAAVLLAGQAMAFDFDLMGENAHVHGYINQGVQFGVAGDHYDTMAGFQGALTQALLEMDYSPSNNVKFFLSGQLVKDWAYNILDGDDDWEFRRFDESRSELSLLADYEDYLKEAHVSWTPGNFFIRVGKQIDAWSRMDIVRIMDQINPRDTRRGFADVEFETSIIPVWLIKTEYFPEISTGFINELGLEFTFNPNADFIGNKGLSTGNYEHGIWAANSFIPQLNGRVGAVRGDIEKPDNWNSDGFEYALAIKALFPDDTYLTLNYFDGVDNDPVSVPDPSRKGGIIDAYGVSIAGLNGTPYYDDEGHQIIEPYMKGFYPDKRYAGFTVCHDFTSLYVDWLGGVTPLVRFESIYEFDTTFTTSEYKFEEHDAIYYGASADWKFKWNLLNPRRFFSITPLFAHRHVQDYPDSYNLNVQENTYTLGGMFSTQYLHDKLTPRIVYQRTLSSNVKSDLWIMSLEWAPNDTWKYKAQLFLLGNDGYDAVDDKDNLSFTVQYQF